MSHADVVRSAPAYFQRLHEFVESLASVRLAVIEHTCYERVFGCFHLVVQNEEGDLVKFSWDGKDSILAALTPRYTKEKEQSLVALRTIPLKESV